MERKQKDAALDACIFLFFLFRRLPVRIPVQAERISEIKENLTFSLNFTRIALSLHHKRIMNEIF